MIANNDSLTDTSFSRMSLSKSRMVQPNQIKAKRNKEVQDQVFRPVPAIFMMLDKK